MLPNTCSVTELINNGVSIEADAVLDLTARIRRRLWSAVAAKLWAVVIADVPRPRKFFKEIPGGGVGSGRWCSW
jgi:hypothetical protein